MGINAETVELLAEYAKADGAGRSVMELGGQDLTPMPKTLPRLLTGAGLKVGEPIETARALYQALGFADYKCIDAIDQHGALNFDLNLDLQATYGFDEQFDLVTNFGTSEHCFNQYARSEERRVGKECRSRWAPSV